MLHLKVQVPETIVLDQFALQFSNCLRQQGAHWFRMIPEGLQTDAEAKGDTFPVTGLKAITTSLLAVPVKTNTNNSLFTNSGPCKGLVFRHRTHCGFSIPCPDGMNSEWSFVIRFYASGQDAQTLMVYGPDTAENYIFLKQDKGTLLFKDNRQNLEILAEAKTDPNGIHTIIAGQSNGRLFLRVGTQKSVQTPNSVDLGFGSDPAQLFLGCRGHMEGLFKTLGSWILKEMIFWPDKNILEPDHFDIIKLFDRYVLWGCE